MLLAVQEERQKLVVSGEGESPSSPTSSTSSSSNHMNTTNSDDAESLIDELLMVEYSSEPNLDTYIEKECSYNCLISTNHIQLSQLINWAKRVPYFTTLSIDDQIALVRASWRDILCCSLAYRSIMAPDCGLILSVSSFYYFFRRLVFV